MRNNKNNITSSARNITLNLQNITPHFTGKVKIITLVSVIIMLSFVNIINTSALSYQSSVGVGFTFNPTLSVNISPSDLTISNLTPGTASDSNTINISVATNAAYGYTLSAIINGNNNNLIHVNNTNTFSSITADSSLPSLVTDNTWGYSYKLSNDANWNNYSGLSIETSKTLVDSNDQTAIPIDFKIGAKAASTQASGTYTGTINFTAVTKPTPMNLAESYFAAGKTRHNGYYAMQDMTTEICNNTEVIGEGSQTELIDLRDDKVYWATKLADRHCWMTQNLDLDLSHDKPLTSEDTDLNDSSLSGAYSENYKYDPTTGIIAWTPINTTRNYNTSTGTIFKNNYNIAYSLDPGNWYWNGNDETATCDYLNTSCEDFSQTPYNTTNTHGHIGNYYNWSAAIASDDSSNLYADTYNKISDNPKNSICPKNWRLPFISSSVNELAGINKIYNNNRTNNDTGLISSPVFFVRPGYITNNSIKNSGYEENYWSSTVASDSLVYTLYFRNNKVDTKYTNPGNRRLGWAIRCIAK